jgi:hypothetical protein
VRRFQKSKVPGDDIAPPARLNLLLSGFARQQVVAVDEIVRAVDALPAFHLEGLREIVYLPEYGWAASALSCLAVPGGEPKAEFVQRERRIFVYGFATPELFFHLLYHEIGHFVFFLVLGSQVKKRWVTELFPGSACVSAYGGLNASEDFAETYAYHLLDRELLERVYPEKHAFMRDQVFSGRPGTLKERSAP